MTCHVCGKKIIAGYALCGECGHTLGDGIERTRLGYFVEHPDQMVEELIQLDAPWCKNFEECITAVDRDEELDDEKCRKCCMDWLMEKVDGA